MAFLKFFTPERVSEYLRRIKKPLPGVRYRAKDLVRLRLMGRDGNGSKCVIMGFQWLKTVHISLVGCSYTLFVLRGVWHLNESALIRRPWVRVVPHVIDTLLLASALALALGIHQYPIINGWLTAKVVGLLVYIALGVLAFRVARSRSGRLFFWLAAQLTFLYIVRVAMTHHPVPWSGLA